MNLPDEIVQAIVNDLQSRSELGKVWEQIDVDKRYEIMSHWRELVREQIDHVISEICLEE